MERIDGVAVLGREGNVNAVIRPQLTLADPEERKVVAEATHLWDRLHDEPHAQGREGLLVEGLAALILADIQPNVIKPRFHGASSLTRAMSAGVVLLRNLSPASHAC